MREIIRQVGFFMLGIFSLFFVIFGKYFAKMYLQLSFLNFPVFVGEFVLFICLILSFFVFDFRSIKGRQWAVVFYFVCVILKALWGYSLWGALALRHAALFYYPFFIFLGFIFYNRAFLSEPLKIFIVSLILVLCVTKYFYEYWVLTLWIIALILTKSFTHRAIKYFFYTALFSIIVLSYKVIILTSRTFIVGNISAVIFLVITILLIVKIKVFYKPVIAGAIFILLGIFIFKFSFLNASGTILDIKGTMNQYRKIDRIIETQRQFYVPRKLKEIKLFNSEQPAPLVPVSNKMLKAETPKKEAGLPKQPAPLVPVSNKMLKAETPKKENVKPIMRGRSDESSYGNTLFRLFIWRDMIVEFSRHWPILGFSFGKPFRSDSLEIMDWAGSEWSRDGWIEPHNSYLNILYRMGILGIALLGFLIWQFCNMVKSFIAFKSLSGILLCSILINWLVAANFLPLLELPYNAIPFWALWGLALGYLKEIKNQQYAV